ncbi:MAG: FG-GAP-like repeat-containing protein [Candidatus Krumholzibacteriota bacterium]
MRGIDDLETVYSTSEFLGMTFYFGAPYEIPEGRARANWYGVTGTPTVWVGGTDSHVGGLGSGSMFYYYNPSVISQLGTPSPLVMAASYVLVGGTDIELSLQIDVDLAVGGSNNEVKFFVCQEGLHEQSNMVVDMLANEPFALTTPGQTVTIDRSFTMDPSWNEPDLRLIIVVQDMTTKEILQATLAVADYAAQVIVDADPDGVEAPWTLVGPGLDISHNGDRTLNLWDAGTYTITWDDVPYWVTPANNPETQTVAQGGVITFLGSYTGGPFDLSTAGPIGNADSGQAVSMVDVDNDGDLDIHVVNEGTADQVLRNDGVSGFTDIASGAIAEAGPSRGSAWADIDGDGNLDVMLSRNGDTNILMTGDGSGGFTAMSTFGMDNVASGSSTSWIDFDLDGILDLYVVNKGEANELLKGIAVVGGTYYFSAVAGNAADLGEGSAAAWGDGNLDGRPDLFIANQFSANRMLENTTIGFSDITNSCGIGEHLGKAMGSAWGDYDNDGDFDLYVVNEGMADLLYRCAASLSYTQIIGPNLGDRGDGRGVTWIDFDNDTFLDLYIVRNNQPDLMLMGDGAGNFFRVPVGPAEADGPGNAVACGDIDDDGDLDLFISREGATNVLFTNKLGDDNRWIKLHLTAPGNNTCAIGTRVVLTAGGVSQSRMVTSGSGYLCNNAMDVHFGLGASTTVDQIEIFWPDGTHQLTGPTFTNQTLAIVQGQPVSPVPDAVPARTTSLGQAHPNPFNPSTTIEFALAGAGHARLDVFTIDGRHVRTLVDRGLGAGPHTATWDGTDHLGHGVASGAYFYRLTTAGGFSEAGRMVLVK